MISFTLLLLLKIFICIIFFIALLLIIPVKYSLEIKNLNYVFFRIHYFFGIIKFEFETNSKNKFEIPGINLLKKTSSIQNNNKQNNNKKVTENFFELHKKIIPDKNKFNTIKPMLRPTLEFIKDIVKKIHPKIIQINGEIGLDNPADTAWFSLLINFLSSSFNLKQNIKYNFQNEIFDLQIILRGKTYALHFLFIVIKYLHNEHIFSFFKNNFISNEVY